MPSPRHPPRNLCVLCVLCVKFLFRLIVVFAVAIVLIGCKSDFYKDRHAAGVLVRCYHEYLWNYDRDTHRLTFEAVQTRSEIAAGAELHRQWTLWRATQTNEPGLNAENAESAKERREK